MDYCEIDFIYSWLHIKLMESVTKKMFLWILFGFAIWFKLCQAHLNFLQSCSKHLHFSVNFIYFFVDNQNGFGFDWFIRNTQNTSVPLSQGMNFEPFAYPPSDELHPDHDDIADVVQGKSDTQAQSSANGTNECQVWSLTQFYSVDFSLSKIDVKKCVFNKRTIKVCVSCC